MRRTQLESLVRRHGLKRTARVAPQKLRAAIVSSVTRKSPPEKQRIGSELDQTSGAGWGRVPDTEDQGVVGDIFLGVPPRVQ